MGTRPEDMRYEVGAMVEGGEPWLFAVRDTCTMDCESDANVSGVHRAGCGLEPMYTIRELRIAWQKQQRYDELVAYCSRLIANRGVAVKAVSGVDPDRVAFEGRACGFQDLPSVIVELADGTKRQWVAPLVRPVVPTAVWDDSVAPGGMVCVECGVPVESEPCGEHGAMPAGVAVVREVPIRKRADAPDPELVADMLLDGEPVPGSQMTVEQARTWLHGPGPEGEQR